LQQRRSFNKGTALPPAPGLYEKRDKNFTPANAAYVLLILIWFPVQSTPHDKPIALGKPRKNGKRDLHRSQISYVRDFYSLHKTALSAANENLKRTQTPYFGKIVFYLKNSLKIFILRLCSYL